MATQKCKNDCSLNFLVFLNAYLPKTHLIKIHNSLDSSRPYGRLSESSKTWGFIELFLPENDFKTCSAANSAKWMKNHKIGF